LKPHVVEVIARGIIYGAYEGKNTWDDLMKSTTPCYLDVSSDIATLQSKMDGLFEYLHNPLCHKGFEDFVHMFSEGRKVATQAYVYA
jgi:hypothetical protein